MRYLKYKNFSIFYNRMFLNIKLPTFFFNHLLIKVYYSDIVQVKVDRQFPYGA